MFQKTRIKYAYKCGKLEHKFGRLLGLAIFINITLEFLSFNFMIYKPYMTLRLIMLAMTFLCWLTYLAAHTFEKKLFGNNGPRG